MLTCDDVTPYAQLPHQSASRPASSIIIIIFFIPQVVKIPGVKITKAKIKMSDGQRSGRSTGRVSCKSIIIIIIIIIIIYETRAVAQISVHANVYIGQHTRVCEQL